MAKQIDLEKPLSDEDRHYLVVRDRWADLARADGHDDPRRAKADAEAASIRTQVSMPATSPTAAPPARQPIPPKTPKTEGDDEEDLDPYEDWTYPDLQAEAKARNLPAGGKQEELVKRLYDHDEQEAAKAAESAR